MTTTDGIMESLTVLESKSDSRFLAIHGEDEPQVRAAIDKVLAERGALTDTRFDEFDDSEHPFQKWWKEHGQYMLAGGGRREMIWACRGWIAREQLATGVEVTGKSIANGLCIVDTTSKRVCKLGTRCCVVIHSDAAGRLWTEARNAAPTVSPEQERMVSITTALKAIRCESAGKNDIAYLDEFLEGVRARLTAPPVKPTKQEIVVAVLGQYDFQTQDLGIEELANEIVVRLDAADKEKQEILERLKSGRKLRCDRRDEPLLPWLLSHPNIANSGIVQLDDQSSYIECYIEFSWRKDTAHD